MLLAEPGLRSPRWSFVIGLVVAAVLWGVSAALRESWTCDDAFIVFRYAKNLVSGVGLVFNPGGGLRKAADPKSAPAAARLNDFRVG